MAISNLEKIENAIAQADELSASQSAAGASSRWNRVRGYGITICEVPFLLPAGVYCEFFEKVAVTPLPNSPVHFTGLTNIRGNVVPVYDLAPLINDSAQGLIASAPRHNIVQLGKGEDAAAIVCARPPRTFDLTVAVTAAIGDEIPADVRAWVARSWVVDGRQWYQLDDLSLFQILAGR